jgi:hypothetical protein
MLRRAHLGRRRPGSGDRSRRRTMQLVDAQRQTPEIGDLKEPNEAPLQHNATYDDGYIVLSIRWIQE